MIWKPKYKTSMGTQFDSTESMNKGCAVLGGAGAIIAFTLNLAIWNTAIWGAKIGINHMQLNSARDLGKPQTEIQAMKERNAHNLTWPGWIGAVPNIFRSGR